MRTNPYHYLYEEDLKMEPTVQSLIIVDNHWALLAVLFAVTAFTIWPEQKSLVRLKTKITRLMKGVLIRR